MEDELITLVDASELTGVPVDAMQKAIKAKRKKMWAVKKDTPRGPVYYTTRAAAEAFRKIYSPHVKK